MPANMMALVCSTDPHLRKLRDGEWEVLMKCSGSSEWTIQVGEFVMNEVLERA